MARRKAQQGMPRVQTDRRWFHTMRTGFGTSVDCGCNIGYNHDEHGKVLDT